MLLRLEERNWMKLIFRSSRRRSIVAEIYLSHY